MAAWAGPGDDTDEEIRLCRIVLWLQLTGGEPLVDPLFPETLAYAYGLGRMIQVSSNGSRLTSPA
jgi:MoaA/NifB/PqqE/SkfB family radical SAM enzyme